jgi:metal-dependent amidase/aminoacylase/carboxypeptidase family protein
VKALRQHLTSDARVHGIVTHGGRAANIIPDYAAGRWLIRALSMADAMRLLGRVKACAEGAAAATGARLKMTIEEEVYEPFQPNRMFADLFRANLALLGVRAEAGREDREIGSSDIGNVSQLVPTIHPALAISPKQIPIHTPQFAKIAGSPRGLKGMLTATQALAFTAIDLLTNPEALRRIRAEHRARR